jgi:protocatechuate 3,4-dioxygenase beta subunit
MEQTLFDTRWRPNRRSFLSAIGLSSAFFTVRGAFTDALVQTPAQTEGPYYPDHLPLDRDNDLLILNHAITPAVGAISWLSGRVLDATGAPIRGAVVEICQADDHGAYLHSKSPIANRDVHFSGIWKVRDGFDRLSTSSGPRNRAYIRDARGTFTQPLTFSDAPS